MRVAVQLSINMSSSPRKVLRLTNILAPTVVLRGMVEKGTASVNMDSKDLKSLNENFKPFCMSMIWTCWNNFESKLSSRDVNLPSLDI